MGNTKSKSKSNKRVIVIAVTAVVIILTLVLGVVLIKRNPDNDIKNANSENKTTEQRAKDSDYQFIQKKIGDEITLKTIKLKVNKFESKELVKDTYGETVKLSEGKFVIIDIEVTNITDAEFFFQPSFKISDQKGREYSVYSEKGAVFLPEIIVSESLKPGIKFSGKLYYQAASDSEEIKLIAPKAGTKEIFEILLK